MFALVALVVLSLLLPQQHHSIAVKQMEQKAMLARNRPEAKATAATTDHGNARTALLHLHHRHPLPQHA